MQTRPILMLAAFLVVASTACSVPVEGCGDAHVITADDITVPAGMTPDTVESEIEGYVLRATVVDRDGKPVVGARVSFWSQVDGTGGTIGSAVTDDAGIAELQLVELAENQVLAGAVLNTLSRGGYQAKTQFVENLCNLSVSDSALITFE